MIFTFLHLCRSNSHYQNRFFESPPMASFQKTNFGVSSAFGAGNTKIGFIMRIAAFAELRLIPNYNNCRSNKPSNFLKGLRSKPFKKLLGLGLSAKHCRQWYSHFLI